MAQQVLFFDWEAFRAQKVFSAFREFSLHHWLKLGRPKTVDEGDKITYPDGSIITLNGFINGDYQ